MQTNKDLDLPTQQELLAQFRCDEIAGAALAEFNEQAKPQRKPIEAGKVVDGLGEMMRAWRSGAISEQFFYCGTLPSDCWGQFDTTATRQDIIRAFISENAPT